MPVTPGSSSKLNTVRGVSAMLVTTSAEETSLATKVLPANILVKKSDGKVYLTDGTATLANIPVLVDQVLTVAEKTALSTAFSTGTYVAAAGGVVVHDATGKIDDGSLNVVSSGKIVESYLSEYIDQTTHKVLLSALPDTVRAGVTYVADITARDALSAEQKKSLAFVIDATGDATVTRGAAMYGWDETANSGAGEWIKIAEVESLDIDISAIECSYTNAQAAGAVMYDHPLLIDLPTATDFAALGIEAAVVDIYVFASGSTTWILTSNGDLYGCGYGSYGQQGSNNISNYISTFTKRAENVKEVSCSDSTTWYIDNNNNLYGCGRNYHGNQGANNASDVLVFTKRAENVKTVRCSDSTTWYIDNNNNLYGCGNGLYGQQGSGTSGSSAKVVTFTKRAENVKEVSCSDSTTWYIDNNNDLYGCGNGLYGQQGSGTSGNSASVLTFTKRAENVKTVRCSEDTTWYIDNNNDLYGCGRNAGGNQGSGTYSSTNVFGQGNNADVLTFTKRAENVKEVSCSDSTTWYIDNNNNLYGCGNGSYGQQGSGTSGSSAKVVTFTKRAENVKEVSCSDSTTWYIDNNNDLYGCGNGLYGQQGSGTSGNSASVLTFTKRASNVKEVSCSDGTTWYIDNNNNLYGCGSGSHGQQGSGDTENVLTFTKRDYKTE